MPHAIRIHKTGGPEVLGWEAVHVGEPAPDEVQIRHEAVGLNFIDTYYRSGLYPLSLPSGIGSEAAGEVVALGAGVTEFKLGDRVTYAGGPLGAYCEVRNIPASCLFKLPESISCRTAAAVTLQGLTAAYLLLHTYPVKAGETVLIHAAAGGVGLIACQWAKALGAIVIGTVSTEAKAQLARENGCDHIIFYTREDVAKRVSQITAGQGVAVVYDGVGKDTFMGSMDSLKVRGMFVSFGNASGAIPAFEPLLLSRKGSLFITRPTLGDYVAKREERLALGHALFDVISTGKVKVHISQTYALQDAARAHRDLEARQTTGSTILLPFE